VSGVPAAPVKNHGRRKSLKAEPDHHGRRLVGQEQVRKVVLLAEFPELDGRVLDAFLDSDADDADATVLELTPNLFFEMRSLLIAIASPGGVEGEAHDLPSELGEPDRPAGIVLQGEVGNLIADAICFLPAGRRSVAR
jgi:hypothetical protein